MVRAHCNSCLRQTDHDVVAERCTERSRPYQGQQWSVTYQMLQCRGCRGVTFLRRVREEGHGHFEPPNDEWVWDDAIDYFPPTVYRRTPGWLDQLPKDSRSLLKEVYAALHADSRRLAMMGARTLIDLVMLDKIGDAGTFSRKLDDLVARGFVSVRNRESLEAALEAGHAAIHRGHSPANTEVNEVMDIIENLLQAVYVLEDAAKRLQQSIPPRGKRRPKPAGEGSEVG